MTYKVVKSMVDGDIDYVYDKKALKQLDGTVEELREYNRVNEEPTFEDQPLDGGFLEDQDFEEDFGLDQDLEEPQIENELEKEPTLENNQESESDAPLEDAPESKPPSSSGSGSVVLSHETPVRIRSGVPACSRPRGEMDITPDFGSGVRGSSPRGGASAGVAEW